jgi:hypothetical protein
MDGNQGREVEFRSVIALCSRALEWWTLPESDAGRLEAWRRLDELTAAVATVRTRLEVALVLSRVPGSTSDVGTTPMATEAIERLLLAVNNLIALRDT